MKIAVDFHGVLADLHKEIRTMFYREYGIEVSAEDCTEWKVWQCTPIPKKVFWTYVDFINGKGLTKQLDQIPDSRDNLTTLMCYYPCEILTATPNETIPDVREWLKLNGFPNIKVNSVGMMKATSAEKTNQDFQIYIDDNPFIVDKLPDSKHAIIFDQPWNRHVDEKKYKNVYRAKNWKDVVAICHGIQGVL